MFQLPSLVSGKGAYEAEYFVSGSKGWDTLELPPLYNHTSWDSSHNNGPVSFVFSFKGVSQIVFEYFDN